MRRSANDEHACIMLSVVMGQCSAVQLMQRYGSDARGQLPYDAGVQLGKMLCSFFLIDYFMIPPFRGEIQHLLNRGESMHTLERAIHDGTIPNKHAALDRIRAAGAEPSPDDCGTSR